MADVSEYVISTVEVQDPAKLEKLDTKNSVREKDEVTVKVPSITNACRLQLWEVYVAVTVLVLQPHSSVVFAHVKALCEHNEPRFLCEAVLKEHILCGTVQDDSQDNNMYGFLEEYLHRKFQLRFASGRLYTYLMEALDDPRCGRKGIARVFLLGLHVQALLLNSSFFDGQYEEVIRALRIANLPVNDVMSDGDQDIGEALGIRWDNVRLYDDPAMVLKKHGGWALTRPSRMLTPKDLLITRLTGCSLEQILAGQDVPDSPRGEAEDNRGRASRTSGRTSQRPSGRNSVTHLDESDDHSNDGSNASDFDIDPEHKKVVPFGITICEMYLLLKGLLLGLDASSADLRGSVVGQRVVGGQQDAHILAAAVLADLYMRDQIDVRHWTLSEGNVAVPYQVEKKYGVPPMQHFLDDYTLGVEELFRWMQVESLVAEAPIWSSLEERGIIDNHRPGWRRSMGCGFSQVDVWDLARPDLLLDLKEGYLVAARILYDKSFPDPMDEEANDVLMFCFVLQKLFDMSFEAADGMSRVLSGMTPPFHKGELFPPITMVHAGAVIHGLIDRGYRVATGADCQLANEAADFNERVVERLEEQFFLSDKVLNNLDVDSSGGVTLEEFVEGFRKVDLYKEFRKERMPEDVLRRIVADLAERLFYEVDVNMDGTLTSAELANAFNHRREQMLKCREQRRWGGAAASAALQLGLKAKKSKQHNAARDIAVAEQERQRKAALAKERRRRYEWQAEVERPELPDADVDVDTSLVRDDLAVR